jgi:hypothetical protein
MDYMGRSMKRGRLAMTTSMDGPYARSRSLGSSPMFRGNRACVVVLDLERRRTVGVSGRPVVTLCPEGKWDGG